MDEQELNSILGISTQPSNTPKEDSASLDYQLGIKNNIDVTPSDIQVDIPSDKFTHNEDVSATEPTSMTGEFTNDNKPIYENQIDKDKRLKDEYNLRAARAEKEANEQGYSSFTNPYTQEEVHVDPAGLEDVSDIIFNISPLGLGLGTAGTVMAGGAGVAALSKGIPKALRKKIVKDVAMNPDIATDSLAAVKYANDRNLVITTDMAVNNQGKLETGNMWLDKLFGKLYEKYPEDEYDTINTIIRKVSENPTSVNDVAAKVQKQLDTSYKVFEGKEKVAWDNFKDALHKDTHFKSSGSEIKFQTKNLFNDIDESLDGADNLVKNFLKRTVANASNKGLLNEQALKSDITNVMDQLKMYQNAKNLSKAEKDSKRYLETKLGKLRRQLAETNVALDKSSSTLSLQQLLDASKILSNKAYVKSGAISTNNMLEKSHILAAKNILDKYIEKQLSGDTLAKWQQAKMLSKKKFDTFGYNLSGKNMGMKTDINGNLINAHEADAITMLKQELFSSDESVALKKFKQYEEHLSPDTLQEVKKEYLDNIIGLNQYDITSKHRLIGQEIDDKTFQNAMQKLTKTEDGRRLGKYLLGEDNFKTLQALRVLNEKIKQHLPNGDFSILNQLKNAYDAQGNPVYGAAAVAFKLIKGLTTDILFGPYSYIKAKKFNKEFIKIVSKELDKGAKANSGKIKQAFENLMKGTAAGVGVASTNSNADNSYTVKPGDTLLGLAKTNNLSVNDIKNINNLNSNKLKIGQKLIIPYEAKDTLPTGPDEVAGTSTEYMVPEDIKKAEGFLSKVKLVNGKHPTIGYGYDLKQNSKYLKEDFKHAGIPLNKPYNITEQQASVLYDRASKRQYKLASKVLGYDIEKQGKYSDFLKNIAYNGDINKSGGNPKHLHLFKLLKEKKFEEALDYYNTINSRTKNRSRNSL